MKAAQFEENYITVDGIRTHYYVGGEGIPVVFVHGLVNFLLPTHIVPRTLSRYFRVYIYDLPGFGYTPRFRGRSTILSYARHLCSFIRILGIRKPFIVGFSFGGMITMQYAITHQKTMRGMIVVSSTDTAEHFNPLFWVVMPVLCRLYKTNTFRGILKKVQHDEREIGFLWRILEPHTSISSPDGQHWLTTIKRLHWAVARDIVEEIFVHLNLRDGLKKVHIPSMFIAGEKDFIVSKRAVDKAHDVTQASEFYIMPDATHVSIFTPASLRLIVDFISRHLKE